MRIGKTPGIYLTWDDCKAMVEGYPGAKYKSFPSLEEAECFVQGVEYSQATKTGEKIAEPEGSYAFVDGSYNVAGEILGCMAAVDKALKLGLPQVTIFYDYMGIEMQATGGWKRNKAGTVAYYDYMQAAKDKIEIAFVKVKGHSGIEGNEEADRLAKESMLSI